MGPYTTSTSQSNNPIDVGHLENVLNEKTKEMKAFPWMDGNMTCVFALNNGGVY